LAHTRNKESILQLYDNLLPALASRIHAEIAPVTALFNDFHLERIVDTWTKDPEVYYYEAISIENGNVPYLGLRLRLEGFLKPGVPAFDVEKELVLKLEKESYGLGPDKHTIWLEMPYGQRWTEAAQAEVAERWCAALIEDLTRQLEQFT
jgi:hypothetical protein